MVHCMFVYSAHRQENNVQVVVQISFMYMWYAYVYFARSTEYIFQTLEQKFSIFTPPSLQDEDNTRPYNIRGIFQNADLLLALTRGGQLQSKFRYCIKVRFLRICALVLLLQYF